VKQHASTAALATPPSKIAYQGKLIVFTSFYDYQAHASYTQSMVCLAMVLEKLGVDWDYWPVMGDFHIERCINEAYSRFMRDEKATDILCIDSDESFTAQSVLRLLEHPDEVVAGAYKMKNQWNEWTAVWKKDEGGYPMGKALEDGTGLIEAERLPWGFLRVKKTALQRYVDHFPDLWYWGKGGLKETIFCQLGYIDHHLFSQDYRFSERLKEAGCKLWLDPNVTIGHWGRIEHKGNLHEHLVALKANQDEATQTSDALGFNDKERKAFAEIHARAQEIEQERKAA
jgi:hypothetical protein